MITTVNAFETGKFGRKLISWDLDISFIFSVKQCVRCPGIFLDDTNFCSMHYWENYNVLCRQLCLDIATSLWQVCFQEGWMFAGSLQLSSADRTESGRDR